MQLSCQFAISFFYFVFRCALTYTKYLVIIFEFHLQAFSLSKLKIRPAGIEATSVPMFFDRNNFYCLSVLLSPHASAYPKIINLYRSRRKRAGTTLSARSATYFKNIKDRGPRLASCHCYKEKFRLR